MYCVVAPHPGLLLAVRPPSSPPPPPPETQMPPMLAMHIVCSTMACVQGNVLWKLGHS